MGLYPKDRDLTEPPRQVELPVRASDWQARPSELKLRLDAFLARFLRWRSRSSIQGLIHDGYVFVVARSPERPGGTEDPRVEVRPGRKLLHGSKVIVKIPESLQIEVPAGPPEELVLLWEDEWLLAVDKPAGVAVHPSGRHLTDTLIQRVQAHFQSEHSRTGGALKLCHRLDRETSGVVLIARERRAHAGVMRAFERRKVEKEYLAIVHGVPELVSGVVDLPLGQARTGRVHLKMAALADGSPSRTSWQLVEAVGSCSLLACTPHTGRQHQIRVHMEAIGHPLVGDKLYGVSEEVFLRNARGELAADDLAALGLDRHALHNHRLAFEHPRTGERIEVVSPLARDLEAYLDARREPAGD